MPAPAPAQRAARLGLRAAAALAFLAPLVTRITMGHAFFLTGLARWLRVGRAATANEDAPEAA